MPINGLTQPDIIDIDDTLRLRKYDGNYMTALPWYRNEVVYRNSEGITDPDKIPDAEYVKRMYDWFENNGKSEMYFIEVLKNDEFIPIGDAALTDENLPIVIGVDDYRCVGIGKKVLKTLLERAKKIGLKRIYDTKIFHYNKASQALYTSCGFKLTGEDERYKYYALDIE